ncbi:MAG TPA: glutamate racemase [Acidimicrobiia bacterium]|nr:glutamate racemase [Acidimicrobiia bacterium]
MVHATFPTSPTARGDRAPIGLFDSGLGGLTVVRALLDLVPYEPLLYFGDTARFPYGPKPADDVIKYAIEIGDHLVDQGARLLVVACNSASSVALDALRDRHSVPVVGVIEPGLQAAAVATRRGRVGVIGTVGTIRSGAYQSAAAELGIELTCAACPGFVEFVEAGDVDSDQVHVLAERLLAPLRAAGVDTLVLGCTHYPLLARTIGDVMGQDVVLVSSADETAFAVQRALRSETVLGDSVGRVKPRFVTSGDAETFRRLGARFCGPEVVDVTTFSWT